MFWCWLGCHTYKNTSIFTPSAVAPGIRIRGASEMVLMATHGFTTITQTCQKCGWISVEHQPGDITRSIQ